MQNVVTSSPENLCTAIPLKQQIATAMKFKTKILQSGNNTGIEVPETVITALNTGKKPPVVVTLNNYTYRNTVAVMGGKYLIALSAEHRKNANVKGGDELEVDIQLDTEPRITELPKDFKILLDKNKKASDFYERQPPSGKKKILTLIESAKSGETRSRRMAGIITSLEQGKKV